MKRLIPLLPFVALAACATTPPPPPPPPPPASADIYREADYAWSNGAGDNVILGSVGYRTKAGGAYSCAGFTVALTPATPMSAKRIDKLYGSTVSAVATTDEVRARSAGEAAPPYADFVRTTKCDAAGKFGFQALPDGDWFLVARAKPAKGDAGVVIMQYVEAGGGQTRTIVLK
jgi:hypothetical protein